MSIYTGRGDYGNTNVIGGRTVKKNAPVVEAYGTIDELNAVVGFVITELSDKKIAEELKSIQILLFDCGTILSDVNKQMDINVTKETIVWLEERVDTYDKETPEITKFILPGGSKASAALHIARTVARRAERQIVTLMETQEVPQNVYVFINRLSDYFFALARYVNNLSGSDETFYEKTGDVFHLDD